MFDKVFEIDEIKEIFIQRKSALKNFNKITVNDDFYLSFLSEFQTTEFTADIIIFGYEEAIKENKYVEEINPFISENFWMIGRTGQGDEWFIDKVKGGISFYDHNQGDYADISQFQKINIDFTDFVKMAFLFRELESELDREENISHENQEKFINQINSIKKGLYELYPFKYF